MTSIKTPKEKVFTSYQTFVIVILAIIQFTVILDFMVLSPLGEILIKEIGMTPAQFGKVVSAYAFSAGISGFLAAGFADKFDRKKILLFFYVGFIFGTALCAIAPTYNFLLMARIVTGIFGGVISSVGFAIITDIFKMEVRGRVMGTVQMAFAASQILGLPVGLFLANKFGWHSPFWMIVGFSIVVATVILIYMKPVDEHLKIKSDRNPFQHLLKTITNKYYQRALLATVLLATGGFMLMPFGTTFGINNLHLTRDQLPMLYFVTGIFTIIFGPQIGKLSDKIGKFKTFLFGSMLAMIMVFVYTHLGVTPLIYVIIINIFLFAAITSRMISAGALTSAIPEPQDRGAFMSINSSVQQISGGIAAFAAGKIVYQENANSPLQNYDILGYVVISAMIIAVLMFYFIDKQVKAKMISG